MSFNKLVILFGHKEFLKMMDSIESEARLNAIRKASRSSSKAQRRTNKPHVSKSVRQRHTRRVQAR